MPNDKLQIAFDATMFDLLQLCPARFNYRFNLNRTEYSKPKALDKGTLIHIGMENFFLTLQKKEAYKNAIENMIVSTRAASLDSELEPSEVHRIIEVLQETCKVWKNEDETFEILAVEQPFMYVLFEDDYMRVVMIGKIDLIVNTLKFKNLVVDHKSYERDFPVKRLNNQFTNYAIATDSNYLVVNRIGFQTSIDPDKKHKRVFLSYDDLFKENWKNNAVKVIRQYVDYAIDNDWPMNLTSCDKFNRPCEYLNVCDTSGTVADKLFKLETNFKLAEKWDVSSNLGKKD